MKNAKSKLDSERNHAQMLITAKASLEKEIEELKIEKEKFQEVCRSTFFLK